MTGAVRSIANTGTPGEIETSVAEVTEARYQLLRSRLLTPDELDKLPPPEPLIEHYCSLNSLMTTFGRPGTAKTLMAMTMSFAVVTGTPWFGHPVGQGPVLYIAGEGTSGLAQRQRAWREACGWPDLGGMHWLPMAVNLLDATWTSALVRLVEDLQPKLVTIDTLARSMPGGDENASADMSALVAASDRVREASRATVNLVHHTPKEGSTPRGHSALEGAVDTALLLERNGSQITLTAPKQKDLPTPEPMVFELHQVGASVVPTLPNGRGSVADVIGVERTVRDLVWQSCGSDGLSPTALQRMSGLPERSFYRAMKSLRDRGIVRNVGTPGRPRLVGDDANTANTAKDCHGNVPTLPAKAPPLGAWQYGSNGGDGSDLSALDLEQEKPIW